MGREIRKVPPGWEHPRDDNGYYRGLFDEDFESAAKDWIDGFKKVIDTQPDEDGDYYWELEGDPPCRESFRPKWSANEATHFQVYETVSEGTPVTPAFATKQELVDYLVANGDYSDQKHGEGGWSRRAAEQLVNNGSAPSLIAMHNPPKAPEIFTARTGLPDAE